MFREWLQTKELCIINLQVVLYASKTSHNLTHYLYDPVFSKGEIHKYYNPAVFTSMAALQLVQNLEECDIQSR